MIATYIRYVINANLIVNNTYKLNLSNKQIATLSGNACIAVIGGIDYKGESFSSLRLFKSESLAEKYIVDLLSGESPYTYVYVQIQEIAQKAYNESKGKI
jgi:hypothetical protein